MVFTHYYKIKVYIDNGTERYEAWKCVFADSEEKAKERVLRYYNHPPFCTAVILESYTRVLQNGMMFDGLVIL